MIDFELIDKQINNLVNLTVEEIRQIEIESMLDDMELERNG